MDTQSQQNHHHHHHQQPQPQPQPHLLVQQQQQPSSSASFGSGSGSSHARRLSNPLMAFLSTASTSPSSASAPTSPHRSPAHIHHSHQQHRPSYQQMLRHLRYPGHSQHDLDPSHTSGNGHPPHSHANDANNMLVDPETGMLVYDDGDADSHDDMDAGDLLHPHSHAGGANGDEDDDMHSDPELMMPDDDEDEASGMLGLFGFGGFASGGGASVSSPTRKHPGGRPISGSSTESQPTTTSSSSAGAATAGLGPLRTVHDATALPPSVQLAAAALASGGAAATNLAAGNATAPAVSASSPGPPAVAAAAGIAVLGGPFPALRDWIIVTASQLPLPTITNLGQVNENTINWLNPIVYLQLLTYPAGAPVVEGQPSAVGSQGNLAQRSGSGSKASFSVLRETHLVRQRRRLIIMLSTYTIIMRYCSFDAFVVLLVLSTCLLLYFMKNSRKINVQMAKRNIKQRVGWAKQWAGGLFKRNNNSNANAGEDGDNFMGSAEGGVAFGHESVVATGTSASPNVTSEKKRRRGIPGFKKSNSPGNSNNMIAISAGPNASQTMLAPTAVSGSAASANGGGTAPANAAAGGSGGAITSGTGAAAAAKAAAGARRINNLFRRAASVEPTGDKINPFHADGTANVAAVLGPGLQPQLHGSHSGSNNNLGPPPTASTATSSASSGAASAPASASVTGSMTAALCVPTHEPTLHSSGSVEGGVSHATGGGSGAGAKLSKIFSRRRGNSSIPTPSSLSAPASAVGGTQLPMAPPADDGSAVPPTSARGISSETLTSSGTAPPPSFHASNSVLSSNDTLAIPHSSTPPVASNAQSNPIIVHTHTSAQPITVLSDTSSAPTPWSPRSTAPSHGTPIIPTSISHDSISGLVSLGGGNPALGSSESVQSNSSGGSSNSSNNKRLGGLQGHARSSSDGQYAVLPPAPGRTLTNASTASSSGSVKSGGRIAAAVVGKAKDLWGHVKGGGGSGGHGSGGTTPTLPESPANAAGGHTSSSRSGSLTEVASVAQQPAGEASPVVLHTHSHPLPALPPRKPSFVGTTTALPVSSPVMVEEEGSGALRKTPSRASVGNAANEGDGVGSQAAAVSGGSHDLHAPSPPLPQV